MTCSPRSIVLLATLLIAAPAFGAPSFFDPTFGSGGSVSVPSTVERLLVQPDGKIVTASTVDESAALIRYDADGTLDAGFGDAGMALESFGDEAEGYAVALQPDGKLVVAAETGGSFGLARFDATGALDPTFGMGGRVVTALAGGEPHEIVPQPDGKLVVAGRIAASFGLVRYESDGSLDASFGDVGIVTTSFSAGSDIFDLLLLPDGRLVASGRIGSEVDIDFTFALARYNPDGSLDTSFDGDGRLVVDVGSPATAYGIAAQADGKIIGVGPYPQRAFDALVERYDADGSLDPAFGDKGRVSIDIGGSSNGASAVALQSDGKIVISGYFVPQTGDPGPGDSAVVMRLNPDGTLDTTFGTCGVVTQLTGTISALALAIQPDGNIVIGADGRLARYLGQSPPVCAAVPITGCRTVTAPHAAALKLKNPPGSRGDALVWQWKKGALTTAGDFGDPVGSDDYTLCMYDESGGPPNLVFSSITRPGGFCGSKPCWSSRSGLGFAYHGKGELCGTKQIMLSAGEPGAARTAVKAKGDRLPPLPSLPLALPTRVQLVASIGTCWQAVYDATGVAKNDVMQFIGTGE